MARKKTKLPALLSLLDSREQQSLKKYIASPYFNENPIHIRLLDTMLEETDNPEIVWSRVFPGESYNDLKLRHLRSELLRLVEGFLTDNELKKRNGLQASYLLRALRHRKASSLYEFTWRKISRKGPADRIGNDQLMEHYLLQAEHNSWLEQRSQRSGETHLQATVDSLDTFYLFSKLKYSCTILNNRQVVDVNYKNLLLEEILIHLRKRNYDHIPGIAIYFRIYEMLTEPDDTTHFLELKKLLVRHSSGFTPSEGNEMYAFAMNYCIGKINKGQSEFLGEILELYKRCLEMGILLENGHLSPWNYKNIVVAGLRREEYEWTGKFIHKYREKIPEAYRENAYTYNLAKFYFYKREYSQVLKLLQQVDYDDVFYNLDSKVMLLKIYYELEETEALDSLIDSFRIFLRRNKLISAHHRRNYLNLTRFVKKLSRLRPGDTRKLAAIRSEVAATEQVADVDWLRGKLEGKG